MNKCYAFSLSLSGTASALGTLGTILRMNIHRLIFISILLQFNACFGQDLNIDSLFKQFQLDIQIEQNLHSGSVVTDDDTRETFYSLLNNCSVEDLVKFTNDTNPVVRSKIFTALVLKGADDKILKEILEIHKDDTSTFKSTSGCVTHKWRVIDDMLMIFKAKIENRLPKINYKTKIDRNENELNIIVQGARHGIIEKDKLLETNQFTYSDARFKLVSFSLTNGKTTLHSSDGKLTKRMKTLIKKSESGERLYFENLKTAGPDKTIRSTGTIALIIK